jgi:hypothetical protein
MRWYRGLLPLLLFVMQPTQQKYFYSFRFPLKRRRYRHRCFALEGNRWFELARTSRLVDAVKAETSFGRSPLIQSHHILFPIPQREIGANSALVQNRGY